MSTDIRLDESYQISSRTDGDAATVSGNACILQEIRMEAASAEGDLWYSPDWGWSLLDFKGCRQDELTELEIEQRIRMKIRAREDVELSSIVVSAVWEEDKIQVRVTFRILNETELRRLKISIGSSRTQIEVITVD